MELVIILAGVILMSLFLCLSFSRHRHLVSIAVIALVIVGAGWAYYQQFNKPDPFACAETDGKTACTFKGKPFKPQGSQEYVCEKVDGNMLCERPKGTVIQHKGKTYTLHYFDGKDVYVAE